MLCRIEVSSLGIHFSNSLFSIDFCVHIYVVCILSFQSTLNSVAASPSYQVYVRVERCSNWEGEDGVTVKRWHPQLPSVVAVARCRLLAVTSLSTYPQSLIKWLVYLYRIEERIWMIMYMSDLYFNMHVTVLFVSKGFGSSSKSCVHRVWTLILAIPII